MEMQGGNFNRFFALDLEGFGDFDKNVAETKNCSYR